jgi:hypothetical protein
MYGNTLYKMCMNICYASTYQKKGANERLSLRPCKGVGHAVILKSASFGWQADYSYPELG